jgi:hypothetical protein
MSMTLTRKSPGGAMTKIVGMEDLKTGAELMYEINSGAKFVTYQYVISILIMTFRRSSDIYFIRQGESRITKGLIFSLISLLLGWWGVPWGLIYTSAALFINFSGGKDVTNEVLQVLQRGQV